MKYRELEGIRKPLSTLVYGTTAAASSGDKERAYESLDAAWECGFRVFDTAHSYGFGEEVLGSWLMQSGHREEAVILDKGLNPGQEGSSDIFGADTVQSQIRESFERLQTDHVELYILHRDDESKPVDEIVETLNELKEDGKIDRFGGSNWKQYRIEQANAYAASHHLTGFTVCSPAYSLADMVNDPWGGSATISGEQNVSFREWLRLNQMPVFNYSALGRGYLSGKYHSDDRKSIEECLWWGPIREYHCPKNQARLRRAEELAEKKGCSVPEICLAWLFAQPLNLFPIVNPSSPSHIEETAKASNLSLTAEEVQALF